MAHIEKPMPLLMRLPNRQERKEVYMDQPSGDPKILFDAIVADLETRKLAREYDRADYSGGKNTPTAQQIQDARAITAKAQELRKILRG